MGVWELQASCFFYHQHSAGMRILVHPFFFVVSQENLRFFIPLKVFNSHPNSDFEFIHLLSHWICMHNSSNSYLIYYCHSWMHNVFFPASMCTHYSQTINLDYKLLNCGDIGLLWEMSILFFFTNEKSWFLSSFFFLSFKLITYIKWGIVLEESKSIVLSFAYDFLVKFYFMWVAKKVVFNICWHF